MKSSSTLYRLWGVKHDKVEEEDKGQDQQSYIVRLKLPQKRNSDSSGYDTEEFSREEKAVSKPIHPFFRPRKKRAKEEQPSYLVKLKISPEKLKNSQPPAHDRLTSLKKFKEDQKNKPIHPFFLKKSKTTSAKLESDTEPELKPGHSELSASKVNSEPTKQHPNGNNTKTDDRPIHPFFAKRTRAEKSFTGKSNGFRKQEELDAPWPTVQHVRGTESPGSKVDESRDNTAAKPKGKHKIQNTIKISNEDSIFSNLFSNYCVHQPVKKASRLFMKPQEITNLAYRCTETKYHNVLDPLLAQVGALKPFDRHTWESQSWCNKYSPHDTSVVVSGNNNSTLLLQWMSQQIVAAKKWRKSVANNKKKKNHELVDFIIDDDDATEDELTPQKSNYLILYGPNGCGKTSAVYAAGEELNSYIFEMNSNTRRTGKEIFDVLEGMVKSQLVHSNQPAKNQDNVILIEEVDVLYSDENSFWSGLERVSEVSRRPIILTCNDLNCIPKDVLSNKAELLEFVPAPVSLQMDTLFLIALNEGHLVDHGTLRTLVQKCNLDLRKAITNLQFWCQMGIGGKKSGVDWFITSSERKQLGPVRVISKGEYIDTDNNNDVMAPHHTNDDAETLSCADVLYNSTHSLFAQPLNTDQDRMNIQYTEELPLHDQPLPFEPCIYTDVASVHTVRNDVEPINQTAYIRNLRDCLFFASYPPYSGMGNLNSIDCCQGGVLSTEIAPFVRRMAITEIQRENQKVERLASLGYDLTQGRATRRSYAALGLDGRQRYLACDDEDLNELVKTAPIYRIK